MSPGVQPVGAGRARATAVDREPPREGRRFFGELFADGHYEAAVSELFKSIEVRARTMVGSTHSGVKLVGEAFGGSEPRVHDLFRLQDPQQVLE